MGISDELSILIRARYPILWLVSHEERRAERILLGIAQDRKKELVSWTSTRGFVLITPDKETVIQKTAADVSEAMATVAQKAKDTDRIYLFKDLHKFLDPNRDSTVYRMLRDLHVTLKEWKTTVVILTPELKIPPELQQAVTIVDVPLPNKEELAEVLDSMTSQAGFPAPSDGDRERILQSGMGLTLDQFENVLSKSAVKFKRFDPKLIVEEKEQIIRKSGVVDFYQTVDTLANVGGLDVVKDWIRRRSLSLKKEAQAFGLRPPRGVFIVGVSGCGKSLAIKAMASELVVPLLMMDASKVLGSYLGESERNLSKVLKLAEAVSPCVLFIDEAEKMLSVGNTQTDSGVSSRLFGSLLTWMQERPPDKPVIVAMTANDPSKLPVELFRRFDAVFAVDLPFFEEREAIWKIQLGKIQRKPEKFDIKSLAQESDGWSGGEIEMVVSEGLARAFEGGTELTTDHLLQVLRERKPLSVTRRDDIEKMRKWATENQAIPASTQKVKESGGKRKLEMGE